VKVVDVNERTKGEKRVHAMYSQLDDRWQRIMLGESSTTIGANGCLICAVASGLTDLGITIDGLPPDPPRLNRWLARHKGFAAARGQSRERNLFVFDSLGPLGVRMVEYVDARTRAAPLDRLRTALERDDQFVVIHVDFSPGGETQQHWVRALECYDSDVRLMDPWVKGPLQETYLMTRYALPSWDDPSRAIYRMVVYRLVGLALTGPMPGFPAQQYVQERLDTYLPYEVMPGGII